MGEDPSRALGQNFLIDENFAAWMAGQLDAGGRVLSAQHLLPREFLRHSLIEALAAGQLFTPPIRRLG